MDTLIRFFFDNDVPDNAAEACWEAGHEVIFLREKLPPDSVDYLVAWQSKIENAVLVCFDNDHSKKTRRRVKNLALLHLKCTQPLAAQRRRDAMSLIEAEYEYARRHGTQFHMSISKNTIRTYR